MINKKTIIHIFSLIIMCSFDVGVVIQIVKKPTIQYLIIFIGLVIYTMFILNTLKKEYLVNKLDIKEGAKEVILEFYEIKTFTNFDSRYPKLTTPLIVFKIIGTNSFIGLNGSIPQLKLIKGRKYCVNYLEHSKRLVSIKNAK